MINPYLQVALRHRQDWNWELREKCVKRYSWAIPSNEALNIISKYSGIVEMGAGTGYWSRLLQDMGVSILPFDQHVGEDNTYGHRRSWTTVYRGGDEILSKFSPSVNLFMCWPPYDTPMAYDCLMSFRGKYLIYVGEGYYGCTGDDRFHCELEERWDGVLYQDIPQWYGLNDGLYIYKRR
ncbi:hypothetical protein DRN34_04680 [Thermococci archaeon]|nr:MAG: hypothetical protein DRN34_04680 [Thermococci archaeon]